MGRKKKPDSLQRSDTMSVSMDKKTRALVTKHAKKYHMSKSAFVRLLVLHGLKCARVQKDLEQLYQ